MPERTRPPGEIPTRGGEPVYTTPPLGEGERMPIGGRVPPRRGRRGVVDWYKDDKPPTYVPRPTPSTAVRPRATQRAGREGRDRQLTFTDSEGRCVPLVYGLVRCGARIVYARSDSSQRYTYIVYLICEGPVNSISNITIDGQSPEQLGLVLNTTYKVYLGTSAQTVDTIINGFDANWTSGHPGSAYVTMKLDGANAFAGRVNLDAFQATVEGALVRDPRTDGTLVNRYYRKSVTLAHADFLTNRRYGPGLPDSAVKFSGSITESANDDDANVSSRPAAPTVAPTVAATVDTVNYSPLYNGGTYYYEYTWIVNGVESPPSPASTVYTYDLNTDFKRLTITLANGPAGTTAKRVYRRRSNYGDTGYNLIHVINDNTTTAFDDKISDYAVTPSQPPASAPVPRYAIGLWMGEQATLDDWNDTFNALHAGFMSYDGAYNIWVDKARTASAVTFDESNIIGEPEIFTEGLAKRWSKVTYWYTDSEAGFKNARATVESPNIALPANENEREEKVEADYRTFGVPSYDQAMRLARLEYNRSRRTQRIRFLTNAKGVRALPGLVVAVTHSVGPLAATLVTVLAVTPMANGSTYQIDGAFYAASDYSDTVQSNPAPIIPGSPSPFLTPPNPTGVTLSEVVMIGSNNEAISKIKIEWTNATWAWYKSTKVTVHDQMNEINLGEFKEGPAYFDSPRYNVQHTVKLYTLTTTNQVSTGVTATITPSLGGEFVAPPPLAVDVGDGTTYWDASPYLVFGPTYATSFWTNSGFTSYDGTKVNDGSLTGTAFTLPNSICTLTLDLGSGNTKTFRGFRATAGTAFTANEGSSFGVRYSDDNISYTGTFVPPGSGSHGLTRDGKHWVTTWLAAAGAHRYWQLRWSGAVTSVAVTECQFFEASGGDDVRVDHYELWDTFTSSPMLIQAIPASSRPTSTKPLSLMGLVQPNSGQMQIAVTAVMANGVESARYDAQITAPAATGAGYVRVQASSPTKQTGYVYLSSVTTNKLATDGSTMTLANGDNNNVTLPTTSFAKVSGPTAAFAITGIVAGADGQILQIYNPLNQTMTVKNENANSTAANRILTLSGADLVLRTNLPSTVKIQYEAAGARWIVLTTN